jgi:hypothetical protein
MVMVEKRGSRPFVADRLLRRLGAYRMGDAQGTGTEPNQPKGKAG